MGQAAHYQQGGWRQDWASHGPEQNLAHCPYMYICELRMGFTFLNGWGCVKEEIFNGK